MAKESQATDGQNPGQAAALAPAEEGDAGDDDARAGGESSKEDSISNLEARFDLLNDSLTELRQAILDRRSTNGAAAPQVPDVDDDEPLTASKVKKIVQNGLSNVVQQNQDLVQRQTWDDKAKSEFPLSDPKFLREFKREWREQTASGLDPRHPKAVYNVAQITARSMGVKKPAQAKPDAETAHTSEAPSSNPPPRAAANRGGRPSTVADDDPRLRFYKMKGDRTKDQIEAMKQRLGARDATKRSAR